MVQIQLCIVYFASGLEKAMGEQWWNGEAIWRSLMLPVYNHFDFSWISRFPLLAKLGAWGTLIVEMGYPFFVWSRRTRRFWVAATIALHLGIGLFLGLHTFSALMTVLTLSAFGFSAEPSKGSCERVGCRSIVFRIPDKRSAQTTRILTSLPLGEQQHETGHYP
jgi:hypothetical protein